MKIIFIWDWEPNYYQTITWQDGLAAALKELQRRGHDVTVICAGKEDNIVRHPYFDIEVVSDIPQFIRDMDKPDVLLFWADMTRPNAKPCLELGIPMALCFAGGEALGENVELFDHIFVESQVYEDKLRDKGYYVSRAFGTNTELFKPTEQPKVFDTIFPATFALWKRHELYAQSVEGLQSLAVGFMYQDHETECWKECVKRGTTILPHVSAEALKYLYAASKICVIPSRSDGGSQRTVLEAMAMNLPVIITDSDKFDFARGHGVFEADPTKESIRGYIDSLLDGEPDINTRDYVVNNWSEYTYALALETELLKLLS